MEEDLIIDPINILINEVGNMLKRNSSDRQRTATMRQGATQLPKNNEMVAIIMFRGYAFSHILGSTEEN